MTTHKSTFVKRYFTKVIAPLAALALIAPMVLGTAQAAPELTIRSAPISGFHAPESWYGSRPLLLLPLQYGPDFNVDQKQFQTLFPYAEQAIQTELMQTEKLSVFQVNDHSPVLMRAVLDEKITQDQLDTLIKSPTLENANTILSAMQFDAPPMIAIFSLGKITTYSLPPKHNKPQAPIVQAQVTGMLYNMNNTTAIKSVVMTSDMKPRNEEGFWPNDRILLAIDNAAKKIAAQFVMAPAPLNLPVPVGLAYPEKVNLKDGKPITWVEPVKPVKPAN
ncbi:MAG: hypothetical protein ABI210_03215 [Abditibacteriaceae bacterium]